MEENPQKNSFVLISTKGYILGIVGIILLTAGAAYFVVNKQTDKPIPIACTQEAKLCPDGSAVGRTGPNCEFALCPEVQPSPTPPPPGGPVPIPTPSPVGALFGSPVTFAIGKQVKFGDGLAVTLVEINDSRCPAGAVCVWAGELSPLFRITGGNAGTSRKEVRLGTTTATSVTQSSYTFALQKTTVAAATIIVMKEGEEVSFREGQRDGSLLVEKIYTDYITGLNFPEYPVGGGPEHPVTLRIGESASNGCTITFTLARIEGEIAIFTKKTDFNKPCPICLAQDTLIDTPSGAVAVQNMKRGMAVWTTNAKGERMEATILATSKTPVSVTHQVIHIVLEDGRELFVSPGHPTADGRTVGELFIGDVLDRSRVKSVTPVSYTQAYTYDILPAGETGFYWANGILMGSTLK